MLSDTVEAVVTRARFMPTGAENLRGDEPGWGWRQRINRGVLGACLVVAVALLASQIAARARPAWWVAVGGTGGVHSATLAGALDNGAWSVATMVRPMRQESSDGPMVSEPWAVSVSQEAAAAWLGEHLPRLTGGEGARVVRVRCEPGLGDAGDGGGGVVLVGLERGGAVVWLRMGVRVDEGGVWVVPDGAGVGRLRVSMRVVLGGGVGGSAIERVMLGLQPLCGPVLRLPDGRRLRVLGVGVRAGRLDLRLRTEADGSR